MIIIVGAGIAGLSLGYALMKQGSNVTVLEAATIASGASGVATSYLEPRLGTTPIRAVEWEGLRLWPSYVEELREVSGVECGLRMDGQLRVCLPENEDKFQKDLASREQQDWNLERLSPAEAQALEPALSPEISSAAFLPDIGWVNGKATCHALASSLRLGSCKVLENCGVMEVGCSNSAVQVLDSKGQTHDADKIVFCNSKGANAFVDAIPDMPVSRAVRGVNLIFDIDELSSPISHLIKHHRGNMCPRITNKGSHLIVGTTYEPGEESLNPEQPILDKLLDNAEPILPELRKMPLLGVTAGLRSKVGDGNLRLGRSEASPNVYFSLSHAGAGFLRGPAVASEFADFVLNGKKGPLTGFLTTG